MPEKPQLNIEFDVQTKNAEADKKQLTAAAEKAIDAVAFANPGLTREKLVERMRFIAKGSEAGEGKENNNYSLVMICPVRTASTALLDNWQNIQNNEENKNVQLQITRSNGFSMRFDADGQTPEKIQQMADKMEPVIKEAQDKQKTSSVDTNVLTSEALANYLKAQPQKETSANPTELAALKANKEGPALA